MLYYLAVYVFMNLGAFAAIALVRNATYGERVEDFTGLGARLPVVCGGMVVCCMSLVGIWPAGGFVGKFMVFGASLSAGWASPVMWALVGFAGLNTVWSLFYYARVLQAMYLRPAADATRLEEVRPSLAGNLLVFGLTAPILALGVFVAPLSRMASAVADSVMSR